MLNDNNAVATVKAYIRLDDQRLPTPNEAFYLAKNCLCSSGEIFGREMCGVSGRLWSSLPDPIDTNTSIPVRS